MISHLTKCVILFSVSECAWLTYYPHTSYCQLLSNCSGLETEHCQDCISAKWDCRSEKPTCRVKGECLGIVDHVEEVQSVEDCLQRCNSTFGCAWFTYYVTASECLLFKNCPSIDESREDCISGERRCIDDLPQGWNNKTKQLNLILINSHGTR